MLCGRKCDRKKECSSVVQALEKGMDCTQSPPFLFVHCLFVAIASYGGEATTAVCYRVE